MFCPYCAYPLRDNPAQCPQCGFDQRQIQRLLGIAPNFHRRLLDRRRVLSDEDRAALRREIARLEAADHRVALHIALEAVPPELPLLAYGFWLANSAQTRREHTVAGESLDALLLIDPQRGEVAWTLGYGLEPWLSPATLRATLEAGQPHFARGHWGSGALQILQALDGQLRELREQFAQADGTAEAQY